MKVYRNQPTSRRRVFSPFGPSGSQRRASESKDVYKPHTVPDDWRARGHKPKMNFLCSLAPAHDEPRGSKKICVLPVKGHVPRRLKKIISPVGRPRFREVTSNWY